MKQLPRHMRRVGPILFLGHEVVRVVLVAFGLPYLEGTLR